MCARIYIIKYDVYMYSCIRTNIYTWIICECVCVCLCVCVCACVCACACMTPVSVLHPLLPQTHRFSCAATHRNTHTTLQHTATHCNTLQRTATHCNTPKHTATHHNTPQRTVTYYNTLKHTATRCNTLLHTATQFDSCVSNVVYIQILCCRKHTTTHRNTP